LNLELLLLVAPVLLFSMVAHEYAHGYAALKQGDDTAFMLGRLTWNPVKHIDPIFTLLIPALTLLTYQIAFGGAKPVPVNPRKYTNYRRGDIIVSLAGIVTNLILAVLFTALVPLLGLAGRALPAAESSIALVQVMFVYGININLVLAAFNLMPIPPLDGSHVVKHLLPASWARAFQRAARFGFILLLALVTIGRPVLNLWMQPIWALSGVVTGLLKPYILPSPWTT
jgi:Zn-dependent protease